MTSLRRFLGLPRLSTGAYALILALFLLFAYVVTGPVYRLLTRLYSFSAGSFYEPKDLEREEHVKTLEQQKR